MSDRDVHSAIALCQREDQPIHSAPFADPRILGRIHLLPEADQHLLTLALSGRHTFRQIAALVGRNPGSIYRRVSMLLRRLSHAMVIALLERPIGLTEKFQQVGLQRHLFARGIRTIARESEFSESEVRGILHYLEKWLRMSREIAVETTSNPRITALSHTGGVQ